MDAEPTPASFENAARLNPCTKTPTAPPAIPIGLNAPLNICINASPIISYLDIKTKSEAET